MLLQKLRSKAINNAAIKTGVLVVIGVAIFFVSGIFNVLFGGKELNVSNIQDLEGKYVSYEVWTNYSWYVEGYTKSSSGSTKTDYYQYLVPVGEEQMDYYLDITDPTYSWIGVQINSEKQRDKFDYVFEQYFYTVDTPEKYKVSGYLRKMDYEEKYYYEDYISYNFDMTLSEIDAQGNILTYVIDTNSTNEHFTKGTAYALSAVGVAAILFGVYIMYAALSMKNHKDLVKYLVDNPEKDEKISSLLEKEAMHGVRMNSDYFIVHKAKATTFMETKDIVWVYHHVTQHRTNGIKTGKTHALMVATLYGKVQSVNMPNEAAVLETMEYMRNINPKIVLGYSNELAALYSSNPSAFLTLNEDYAKLKEEQQQSE